MKNKLILLSLFIGVGYASDNISYNNYIQDPFNGAPSAGGTQIHLFKLNQNTAGNTQVITESTIQKQTPWERLLNDGTYNIQLASSATSTTVNTVNFAYGANLFAQTGSAFGFSFGGNLAIINPYFSSQINGTDPYKVKQSLPANQVIFPNQLFAEYKIINLFQVDAGWLYIDAPWVTSQNAEAIQLPTFQGVLVNYQMSRNILWTGIAFNGYMPISATGFSGLTMNNPNFNVITSTPNINGSPSPGTIALGIKYGQYTNWKANLWGYAFQNYANLLYADTQYTLNIDHGNTVLTFAAQAANEGSNGGTNNVFTANGYGTPQSNMLGAQIGVSHDWFAFYASYNLVSGNSTAYHSGGLVSPYTNTLGTDPMYTSSWLSGLVERSAGSAIKLSPNFTFFNKSLTIIPSYTSFMSNPYPTADEWDMFITYNLPEARGLSFNSFLSYEQQPIAAGGNFTYAEFLVSYIY